MLPAPLRELAACADGLVCGRPVHVVDLEDISTTVHSANSNNVRGAQDNASDPCNVARKALVFLREFVRKGRPVVLEDTQIHAWPALSLWTSDYMVEKIGNGTSVRVNATPNGRADAVYYVADAERDAERSCFPIAGHDLARAPPIDKETRNVDEHVLPVFAQPLELRLASVDFFDWLRRDMNALAEHAPPVDGHVLYLSAQNSNLESDGELALLLRDLVPDGTPEGEVTPSPASLAPAFAVEAFGCAPDAINLWIGNSRSVSSMHHDPYDNLYVVVRGEKRFTLLPPCDAGLLDERNFPSAHFRRKPSADDGARWELCLDESTDPTPWIAIDPDAEPSEQEGVPRSLFDRCAKPIRVTVRAGQLLYLPANWFHQVSHGEGDDDGKSVAVNFWFDQPYDSLSYTYNAFLEAAVAHWRQSGELSQASSPETEHAV